MDLFYDKLKISKEEFLFQYQSHPNYPSVLAFSDTLNFLGVKNEGYEIDKENWNELPKQFITVYDNKFTLVEKLNDGYLINNEKSEKVSVEKLYHNSENIVFIFNLTENINDKKKLNYNWIIYSFSVLVLIYSYFQVNQYLFIYNLLSTIGLYISLELFNNKFGKKSIVINKICNNSSNKSEAQNSCSKIFKSDKVNFLGLKLSDFSLVYFLGLFIIGTFIKESFFLLKCISFLSILVILYSVSVQAFVEKVFCKVCLLIIFILLGQIIIASLTTNNDFNLNILLISVFILITLFFLIIYINDILTEKEKYHELSLKNLRFKKNYDIFKRELQIKYYKFNTKNEEFLLGNKNSKFNISIITNPYCGYCKEVYKVLEKIIKNYPDISIQLRFNYLPNATDDNLTILISTFRNIYKKQGQKILFEAINFWHNKNNIEQFKKKYEQFIYETEMSGIIELAKENKDFELTYTPQILINNYLFPNIYDREDILYFIDELLEDEEILNENV